MLLSLLDIFWLTISFANFVCSLFTANKGWFMIDAAKLE
jgi:hypothetical protein